MAGGVEGEKAERYLEFAANMTTACFQLYNQTASGGWQGSASAAPPAACSRLCLPHVCAVDAQAHCVLRVLS